MRWFTAILFLFVLLWGTFTAAPFVSLYRLAEAVQAGDQRAVAKGVNLRALRVSLARQVLATALEMEGHSPDARRAADQAAASLGLTAADPIFAELAAPANLVALLGRGWQGAEASPASGGAAGALSGVRLADLWRLYAASEGRGFRRVLVSVPPGAAPGDLFRLELRFYTLLRWRVTAVELPRELRFRIAREALRRLGRPVAG